MTQQSEAQKLIVKNMLNRFREAAIGDLVSHGDLKKLNKGSARPHYWAACRAMWLLNQENGAVFATINREGYRRLDTSDGANYAGEHARSRIQTASRRGFRRLENVAKRSNDIPPDQLRKINQYLSTFGLVTHLTRRKTIEIMPDTHSDRPDDLIGLKKALGS